MTWFLGLLIFVLLLLAISLGTGYAIAEGIVGREVTQRNLRLLLPHILAGGVTGVLISFFTKNGWVTFYILYTIGVNSWLLSWFFRKRQAGALLIDVGKTVQNKVFLRSGFLGVVLVGFLTWLFFAVVARELPPSSSLSTQIAQLAFWWTAVVSLTAMGLSNL